MPGHKNQNQPDAPALSLSCDPKLGRAVMAREFFMDALMIKAEHARGNIEQVEPEYDWSGWEKWLRGHLAIERERLSKALGETLGEWRFDLRKEIEAKINAQVKALELRIAELTGSVDILCGIQPPPPAKFPTIRAWREDTIYHEGDIVAFAGGTWQAQRDTARAPGTHDWVCLANSGNSLTPRGTYSNDAKYRCLDVAMVGGSSFVALKDYPGPCPGADWQLLASRGSCGDRGPKGERGLTGPRGERGQAAVTIQSWQIDSARYAATPIMSDGSAGPELPLRGLFEQFLSEVNDA